jgi:hypothetical protein
MPTPAAVTPGEAGDVGCAIVRTPAIAALLLSLAAATALAAPRTGHALWTARPGNPVPAENALPGTRAWYGTPAPPDAVDAYASEVSVRPAARVRSRPVAQGS